MFQFSVPKNGGLNLALLTQYGEEKRGLPTTVIHLLPIEVMMVVDMLPYYFLNRSGPRHVFWTSMASVFNLKYWIEDSLENKNLKFLEFVLECLKDDKLKDLLADAANFPDKKYVDLDCFSLREKGFRVQDETVSVSDFCQVLCNQIFLLKFKLVNWEGQDNFESKAEVVKREPPKIVYSYPNDKWCAKYETLKDGQVVSDLVSEALEMVLPLTTATNNASVEKRKRNSAENDAAVCKKTKLSTEEWIDLEAAAQLLQSDIDDYISQPPEVQKKTEGNPNTYQESEWPFDRLGQSQSQTETVEKVPDSLNQTCKCAKDKKVELHFHFHCLPNNKICIENSDGNFKMSFD